MQDHHLSKRKKLALRFFSYGVMTLAVIVISVVCLLLTLGYRFDFKTQTIEQGGLVQFRSFPTNATIELDGQKLNFKTPGKYNVEAGAHSVTMSLDGYQTWRKNTNVKAGELKWLNYARFVPNSITSSPVDTFSTVASSLPSPDRRWYAVQQVASSPNITLYDIRTPEKPVQETLTIPESAYTKTDTDTGQFSLVEWDFGARYLILKHTLGQTTEYLRIDRTVKDGAVNISRELNLPFQDIHFSGTSGTVFYALSGTDIRKIDLSAKTVSAPLVSDIIQFKLYKSDVLAYVAKKTDKDVVGVYINDKDSIVRSYAKDTPLNIDISSYFDNEYLAVSHGAAVEIIKDPLENSDSAGRVFASLQSPQTVNWLKFASSGRFVVAGNGTQFVTYDLETDETFATQLPGTATNPAKTLQWLDDFYLVSDATDSVNISEFDGMNQHEIVKVAKGFPVTLSEDGAYLFSIGKADTGYTLQSSKMTIN